MPKVRITTIEEWKTTDKKVYTVNNLEIGIFELDGEYYAWRNVCPHAGAPVCEGVTCGTNLPSNVYEYEFGREGQILRCPWHGWEFDLKTGRHWVDPKVKLRGYKVEIMDDTLYLIM